MSQVLDVAVYILEKTGTITTMKLQKLAYYSQAWSLVWDEKPLFEAPIKAWVDGPVIPALYAAHRGKFTLSPGELAGGSSQALSANDCDVIDRVLAYYGTMTGQQLSQLSHNEYPWQEAREGLGANERGDRVIPHDRLAAYYASLTPSEEA